MATSIEDAVSVSKIIYQTRSRKNEKKPEGRLLIFILIVLII